MLYPVELGVHEGLLAIGCRLSASNSPPQKGQTAGKLQTS